MIIYLAYITRDGKRMRKADFEKMCNTARYDEQAIRVQLTEEGWQLDTDYGLSMEECINISRMAVRKTKLALVQTAVRHEQNAIGFNEPCEGRR